MRTLMKLLILLISYPSISQATEYSAHRDGFYYLVKRESGLFSDSYRVVRALKNPQGKFFEANLINIEKKILQADEIIGECSPNTESYGWQLIDKSDNTFMYMVGKTQIDQKALLCAYVPNTADVGFREPSELSLLERDELESRFELVTTSPQLQYGHFKVGSMVKIRIQKWDWSDELILDSTYVQRLTYIHVPNKSNQEVQLFFDGQQRFVEGDHSFPTFSYFSHDQSRFSSLSLEFADIIRREVHLVEISPFDALFKKGETVCFQHKGTSTSGVIQGYTYSGYVIEGRAYQESDLKNKSACKN